MSFTALLIVLFFAHFFADFKCQSGWMAHGKSKKLLPLVTHVAVYTLVLFGFVNLLTLFGGLHGESASSNIIGFILLNGALHLITDYFTSRFNAKMWEQKNNHWFFVGIGFD